MNAKERLDRFYSGESVDRLPNLTIVGSVVTQYNGIDVETYCKDPIAMADAAILAARDLKLDFVQIASDLAREAEGYGSTVTYFADKLPTVTGYALNDIEDVETLKPLKATDIPRVMDLVRAAEYAIQKEPEIYPMVLAVGPATVAGNMRGIEDLMMDAVDEPELVEKLLECVTETTMDFIRELAGVGVKYVYVADPVASLFSPKAYKELFLPCHQKLYAEMEANGIKGRLHMCGNTQGILQYSSQSGAYIIDVDHATDLKKALSDVDGRCVLNGNIDPVADVYSADAQHVEEAILACAERAKGYRCMFMPGCELPRDTKLDNVRAIHKALCKLSQNA